MAASSSGSSADEDEEERKKFAELAGIANKDISDAIGKNRLKQSMRLTCHAKSLRVKRNDEDDEETGDGITPESKKHVAKMLSSYIDSCIEEKEENRHLKKTKKKEDQSGINLFISSKEKLTEVVKEGSCKAAVQSKSTKKRMCADSDSSEDDEALARFAEAAVSGQSIINNGLAGNTTNQPEIRNQHEDARQRKHKQKKKKKKKDKWKDEKRDEHHKINKIKNL